MADFERTPSGRLAGPARRGFTLLEVAVVMVLVAILAAAAVPSYRNFLQRQQLREVADLLRQDLRRAREISVQAKAPVFLSLQGGKAWCWGISRDQPCDCAPVTAGSGGSSNSSSHVQTGKPQACLAVRHQGSEFAQVLLDSGADAVFEPGLGQASRHGSTHFSTIAGDQLHVQLNKMGRVHICGKAALESQGC